MKFLHILKERNSPEALKVIKKQAGENPGDLGIVLIQNAVGLKPELDVPVFTLDGSAEEGSGKSVDDAGLLSLILSSENVMVW